MLRSTIDGVTGLQPDAPDIEMAGLSGFSAASRTREACPCTEIVMLSMHDTKQHIHHALRASARGYALKECIGAELNAFRRQAQAALARLTPPTRSAAPLLPNSSARWVLCGIAVV